MKPYSSLRAGSPDRPPVLVLVLCALVLLFTGACNPGRVTGFDPDDPDGGGGGGDGGGPLQGENPAGCRGAVCSGPGDCSARERCVQGVCLQSPGPCGGDNDCQEDSRCYMGSCVGWAACSKLTPYDPECKGAAFNPGEFKPPVVACKLGGFNSLSLPAIADLDKDGKPEIVTIGFGNLLIAARGDNCQQLWQKTTPLMSSGQGSVAIADLDADGYPEIVAIDASNKVVVFDRNGNLIATAPTPLQVTSTYGMQDWGAPAIVDIDGQAPPEIVAGGQVSRFLQNPARIEVLWTRPTRSSFWGVLPIAADLDGDGTPEVITSDKIYDGVSGADKTPPMLAAKPFYPQVADFNGDGKPDLVLVMAQQGSQQVSIYDFANKKTIFGPFGVAEGGWGGPAVIADFDGDKVPDFGLASAKGYYVYALKCDRDPKPADCKGTDRGVLWSKPTNDSSSGGTASSVFDFNGDGIAEVVYRDECWLRVYSGPDGKALFAANVTSNTALELPVIADVDNDGHADIVVTSDSYGACQRQGQPEAETNTPWSGMTQGILVLKDPMNRWMPSRPIWNQHSYHITNINDNLTVPLKEPNNWATYNNYRQNVQGMATGMAPPLPDYTGKQVPLPDSGTCTTEWRVGAQICNRGAGPAAPPVYGTFYQGDPRMGGKKVCTAQTMAALTPGKCETVICSWLNPPMQSVDLYFRAADDGQGNRQNQCKAGNDLSVLKNATCSSTPG